MMSTVEPKKLAAKKCKNCKQFWGSQSYNGLCSKCYQKANPKPKEAEKPVELEKKEDDQKVKYQGQKKGVQQDKSRCFACKKKLGLLGIQCKCNYVYCNLHRMPEEHDCTYNYQTEGKDQLKKQIQKLSHEKCQKLDA